MVSPLEMIAHGRAEVARAAGAEVTIVDLPTSAGADIASDLGAAFAAGAVTHAVLFVGYGLFKGGVIGNAGLVVYGAVVGFTPIILAVLGSRFFKPKLLRPVPVQ